MYFIGSSFVIKIILNNRYVIREIKTNRKFDIIKDIDKGYLLCYFVYNEDRL